MINITKKQKIEHYTKTMIEISEIQDEENSHILADKLMCEILSDYGYKELVSVFINMSKWYS